MSKQNITIEQIIEVMNQYKEVREKLKAIGAIGLQEELQARENDIIPLMFQLKIPCEITVRDGSGYPFQINYIVGTHSLFCILSNSELIKYSDKIICGDTESQNKLKAIKLAKKMSKLIKEANL